MSPILQDEFDALAKWGTTVLIRHVVPICEKDARGNTQGYGPSLLITNNGSNFLVTAAHVLDPLKQGRQLSIPCAKNAERNLLEDWRESVGSDGVNTDDIAVLRFEGDAQPPYPGLGTTCIPFASLKPHALPRRTKEYFVTGFPVTRTKAHIKNKADEVEPHGNRAPSIDDALYKSLGLNPYTSIALDFDVKSVLRRSGQLPAAPEPQGMSGSPVWEIINQAGPIDPTSNCVVGILIEHRRKDKALVATDISIAMHLIETDR